MSRRSPAVTGAERGARAGERLAGDATFFTFGEAIVSLAVALGEDGRVAPPPPPPPPTFLLPDDGDNVAAVVVKGLLAGIFPPLLPFSEIPFELVPSDWVWSCFDGVLLVACAACEAASLAAAAASAAPFCICAPSWFAPLMKEDTPALKNDILDRRGGRDRCANLAFAFVWCYRGRS